MSQPEQLITDHIDIWTTSILAKSTAGRGSSKKYELYGIKKLRELILELAVRGKLVPQDADDAPASVLLEEIAAKKAELVQKNKIKRPKTLPKIKKDEYAYQLPKGWVWVRLGEVLNIFNGNSINANIKESKYSKVKNGLPYIATKDVNYGFESIVYDNGIRIPEGEPKFKIASKGSVLICAEGGSAGKKCGLTDKDVYFGNKLYANEVFVAGLEAKFILTSFLSPTFFKLFSSSMTGIIGGISIAKFSQLIIAIPPEKEQRRIVSKVNELMLLCDQLEQQTETSIDAHATLVEVLLAMLTDSADANELAQNWARVSEYFDSLFTTEHSIEALKQTVLQLAVMGKLVPQNSEDEPASVLLETIKKVKHSEIRKIKSLPEISEDEKPYTLPDNWEWTRLGNISSVGTGATPSRTESKYWSSEDVSWVSSGETSEPFIFNTKEKVSYLAIKETNVSIYPLGTLIVAMYGQGKTRGQITELKIEAGTNQACAAIRMVQSDEQHRHYIKLFFWKSYEEIRSNAAGGAQPNLNVSKITSTVIPLPPLEEQRRIVTKVDELMKVCDELKDKLQQSQASQIQLTDALIEKALA